MDYYQELGVSQDASVEEIRRAYKTAARLLHPDNQPDQDLRRMAEIQMRRLNELMEVLGSPATRREYDRALTVNQIRILAIPPQPQQPLLRFAPRYCYWAALGLMASSMSVWWIRQPDPNTNGSRREVPESREPAMEAWPRQEVSNHLPVHAPNISGPPGFSAESKPLRQEARFEGLWVFAPASAERSEAGSYPPQYIELRLGRDRGLLSGSYTGRYRVTVPSISPEIRLRMHEKSHTARSALMAWISEYGAAGQAQLLLTSEDRMTVMWWTTRFGKRSALTSGTAVLTRWETRQ